VCPVQETDLSYVKVAPGGDVSIEPIPGTTVHSVLVYLLDPFPEEECRNQKQRLECEHGVKQSDLVSQ